MSRGDKPPRAVKFADAPGDAMRLFYSRETGRLDAENDHTLRRMHSEPSAIFNATAFNIELYAELVNRPYYLCKLAPGGEETNVAAANPQSVRLLYKRPTHQRKSDSDRSVPFEPDLDRNSALPIVLFREPQVVPLIAGRVVSYRQASVRSTSGVLEFITAPLAQ